MIRKFIGPIALLLALVIGDQIRINRPDHKYRLTIEVDTAGGVKTASGVISVHPDRGYARGGKTRAKGDAIALDLGDGKLLIALLAIDDGELDLEEINFLAVRAFSATGQRAVFKQMDRLSGSAAVPLKYMPVLATFADSADPSTMKSIKADDLASAFGRDVRLRRMAVEIVPNGIWPLDFGGALGEPVTRGITKVLPWLATPGTAAAAIAAAGWTLKPDADAKAAFTR